ncbi:hypothetical protein ACFPJ1_09245 [Kribbella qitaiheensis]|uniref:hypothetical protein n=1 Tax=Kribbella qitaiheensis TaxID=1544730 RepID=UPI0036145464
MTTAAAPPATGPWLRLRAWFRRPALLTRPASRPPSASAPQIDLQQPALFTKYPDLIEPDDMILEIRRRIDELYAAGAIDEGTPATLDTWIQSLRALWVYRAGLEQLERRRTRAFATASLKARTTAQAAQIAALEGRLAAIDRALQAEQQAPGNRQRKGSS